jgi:uroporphyrinogen decarboxylase
MNSKENKLRAIRFETPEYIPMSFHLNGACWHHYDYNDLYDIMESHPRLFPDFKRSSGKPLINHSGNAIADCPYTDPWQCVWITTDDGITGSVHQHPLESWDDFVDYKAPDPMKTDGTYLIDWGEIEVRVKQQKANDKLVVGGLPHGHTFLRIQDIRGYENLIFDMCDENPNLPKLIEMVEEFNYKYISKWLSLGPDIVSYPEDLGMQIGPMLSPEQLRKYFKPSYKRLMQPARDAGAIVHMHSDGDIRTLVDDLIDGGVEIINLQDLVNGIDWIADKFSGKTCVELDIDRQNITYFGSPDDIDALIREEVEKIGCKEGGLMMIIGIYPGIPLKNIKAVADAMEKYMGFYS